MVKDLVFTMLTPMSYGNIHSYASANIVPSGEGHAGLAHVGRQDRYNSSALVEQQAMARSAMIKRRLHFDGSTRKYAPFYLSFRPQSYILNAFNTARYNVLCPTC